LGTFGRFERRNASTASWWGPSSLPTRLLKDLIAPTLDFVGLESKLGFKPAPHAERAGH
jgi:hypothetical protein